MAKQFISVPNAPRLPFSPAVRVGDFVFVSGQTGFSDAQGRAVEGIEAQTKQCLENIRQVLAIAAASLDDIVKVSVFLRHATDFDGMNAAYQLHFPNGFPARSTIVTSLVLPEMLVEIECVAFAPSVR